MTIKITGLKGLAFVLAAGRRKPMPALPMLAVRAGVLAAPSRSPVRYNDGAKRTKGLSLRDLQPQVDRA